MFNFCTHWCNVSLVKSFVGSPLTVKRISPEYTPAFEAQDAPVSKMTCTGTKHSCLLSKYGFSNVINGLHGRPPLHHKFRSKPKFFRKTKQNVASATTGSRNMQLSRSIGQYFSVVDLLAEVLLLTPYRDKGYPTRAGKPSPQNIQ